MKIHITTAAVALLASTLALSGCGDQGEPQAKSIGYGNYQPGAQRDAAPQPASQDAYMGKLERLEAKATSINQGPYMGRLERLEAKATSSGAQESPDYSRDQSVDGGFGFPYGTN